MFSSYFKIYNSNSSLQNSDEMVILHYSSLNLLNFTIKWTPLTRP